MSEGAKESSPAATGAKGGRAPMYTGKGDDGTTSLYNGARLDKTADVFEALGDVDELNAHVAACANYAANWPPVPESDKVIEPDMEPRYGWRWKSKEAADAHKKKKAECGWLAELLEDVQTRLFEIGAHVATPITSTASAVKRDRTDFSSRGARQVERLEMAIDKLDATMPPLKTFVFPRGGPEIVQFHIARAVCLRAERHVLPIVQRGDADVSVAAYLNRLSSLLFVAARKAALLAGADEKLWQPHREPEPTHAKESGEAAPK